MTKIKFLTDSASDIPDEQLARHGIEMLCIPIAVDGVGYFDRKSFSSEEYLSIVQNAKEIPVTSKISEREYLENFKRLFGEGYTDVITVTISSTGSGTYDSAQLARQNFYEENPAAKETFNIHVLDSRSYSIGYGHPVIEAAKMAEGNKPVAEILTYLEDWFNTVEIYLGVYALEHLKKSGRVNGMGAFVGELLGIRPIMSIIQGVAKVMDKVRGDKNVVPRLLEAFKKNCSNLSAPVFVMQGADKLRAKELAALIQKEIGRAVPIFTAGAAIVTNTGPRPVAVVFQGHKK